MDGNIHPIFILYGENMKLITNEMIKNFKIMKLGYDFMAYKVCRKESLSFHHLIVPKCECKKNGLGDGYFSCFSVAIATFDFIYWHFLYLP